MNTQMKAIVITSLLVLGLGVVGWEAYERNQINHTVTTQTQNLRKLNAEIRAAQSQVDHQEYQAALVSNNLQVKQNAQAVQVTSQFKDVAQKFFKVAYTFNDQQQWVARKKEAAAYASDEVLNDQKLFNDGKGSDGSNYIAGLGLKAAYNNATVANSVVNSDGTVDGYVKVTYSATSDSQASATTTAVYVVKYNSQTKKLTSVQLLGNTDSTVD